MPPVFLNTCVSITKISSLNSLLTAEAIGNVNVDKANIMTGQEIYKINVQIRSISGLDLFGLPQLVVIYLLLKRKSWQTVAPFSTKLSLVLKPVPFRILWTLVLSGKPEIDQTAKSWITLITCKTFVLLQQIFAFTSKTSTSQLLMIPLLCLVWQFLNRLLHLLFPICRICHAHWCRHSSHLMSRKTYYFWF